MSALPQTFPFLELTQGQKHALQKGVPFRICWQDLLGPHALSLDVCSSAECQTLGVGVGMEKEGQHTIDIEGEHGDGNQTLKVDPHKGTTLNQTSSSLVLSGTGQ